MIITGDLSGIQYYLFDIASGGGGQARRLRARSFFLQMLAECAALRMMRAAGWGRDSLVFCGAGKFILEGNQLDSEQRTKVDAERDEVCRWLLEHLGAQVRFALSLAAGEGTPLEQYDYAMQALQQVKQRAWATVAINEAGWNTASLVLAPLDTPCAICRHRTASVLETYEVTDGETGAQRESERGVCGPCHDDLELGKKLPGTRWIEIFEDPTKGEFDIGGLGVSLQRDLPPVGASSAFCVYALDDTASPVRPEVIRRRLARHIPLAGRQPLDFDKIANYAQGASLLGVLKMDADSLGVAINRELEGAASLQKLAEFSGRLEHFFAVTLDQELARPPWDKIYTVFSGGDDLLLVGPWDVVFAYAFHVRQLFARQFAAQGLTISAGMALVRKHHPLRRAAEQAESLLEQAKTHPAPGMDSAKDQMAAFGQIWKWQEHEAIAQASKNWTRWVERGAAERGWLHSLLQLAEARMSDPLATAHLAYQVGRNYPRAHHHDTNKADLRDWADHRINDFDVGDTVETRYLETIARYALTATRSKNEED